MYQYISTIYFLISNLIYVLFFCYLYHPIYVRCNVQKKVKKNGKTKIVSQPKSVLALVNLILLYGLFKCFTFKIILFILISIIIGSLFLFDRLSPKLNDFLHVFNKSTIMIISWKLIHTIFTLVYVIINPLFLAINNNVSKKISYTKNIITQIANLNLSDNSENIFEKELFKINEDLSNMSDYLFKSQKNDPTTKKSYMVSVLDTKTISDIDSKDLTKSSIQNSSTCNEIKIQNSSTCDEIKTQETNTNTSNTNTSNTHTSNTNTSKTDMIKKIDQINNAINQSNDNSLEDMTITITEN